MLRSVQNFCPNVRHFIVLRDNFEFVRQFISPCSTNKFYTLCRRVLLLEISAGFRRIRESILWSGTATMWALINYLPTYRESHKLKPLNLSTWKEWVGRTLFWFGSCIPFLSVPCLCTKPLFTIYFQLNISIHYYILKLHVHFFLLHFLYF